MCDLPPHAARAPALRAGVAVVSDAVAGRDPGLPFLPGEAHLLVFAGSAVGAGDPDFASFVLWADGVPDGSEEWGASFGGHQRNGRDGSAWYWWWDFLPQWEDVYHEVLDLGNGSLKYSSRRDGNWNIIATWARP